MELINYSLHSSLFILAVIIIRLIFVKHLPKNFFQIMWTFVLIKLLVPINIPFKFSIYNLFNTSQKQSATTENKITKIDSYIFFNTLEETEIASNQSANLVQNKYVYYIIFMVSLVILVSFFIKHIKCKSVYKTSLPCENEAVLIWKNNHKLRRKYSIRILDKISSPLTYGILKPIILLPAFIDFNDEKQLDFILTHEFLHIKKFDILKKFFYILMISIYWFNPIVWVAFLLMNRDIELSCDECVLKTFGNTTKSTYAMTLIDLKQKQHIPNLIFSHFSLNLTKERIEAVMNYKKISKPKTYFLISIMAALSIPFLTGAKAIELENPVETTITIESENPVDTAIPIITNFTYTDDDNNRFSLNFDDEFLFPLDEKYSDNIEYYYDDIFIFADKGASVYSVSSGQIILTGYNEKYGYSVIINHSNKFILYGYLNTINVNIGDTVSKGDIIGTVGNTGYNAEHQLALNLLSDDENSYYICG